MGVLCELIDIRPIHLPIIVQTKPVGDHHSALLGNGGYLSPYFDPGRLGGYPYIAPVFHAHTLSILRTDQEGAHLLVVVPGRISHNDVRREGEVTPCHEHKGVVLILHGRLFLFRLDFQHPFGHLLDV